MAVEMQDAGVRGDVTEQLVLPVGHFVGVGSDGVDDEPMHQVRVGPEIHDLDDTQFQVWTLAHGSPHALTSEFAWGRESVAELMKFSGAGEVDDLIDDLIDDGLLAEVVPGSDSAVDFAREHRVTPLMLGLGNTAEEPRLYGIGLLGQPMLQVDFATYDLWQWSAMDETLWATCESAADVARRAGTADPGFLDPDKLLTGFLRSLHALLMVRAACIDVPFLLRHPVVGG